MNEIVTYSARIDHDNGDFSIVELNAKSLDEAVSECHTLSIFDGEEVRLHVNTFHQVSTTPYLIVVKGKME